MNNWITYLEEYRCNRTILENLESNQISAESSSLHPTEDESSESALAVSSVRFKIKEAECKLAHYIPSDAPQREVRRLADEKLFLSLRYICGMTMIETAFAMCVSRDTVYRIRRRVLTRKLPD